MRAWLMCSLFDTARMHISEMLGARSIPNWSSPKKSVLPNAALAPQ
jgi:hypothetical protein